MKRSFSAPLLPGLPVVLPPLDNKYVSPVISVLTSIAFFLLFDTCCACRMFDKYLNVQSNPSHRKVLHRCACFKHTKWLYHSGVCDRTRTSECKSAYSPASSPFIVESCSELALVRRASTTGNESWHHKANTNVPNRGGIRKLANLKMSTDVCRTQWNLDKAKKHGMQYVSCRMCLHGVSLTIMQSRQI